MKRFILFVFLFISVPTYAISQQMPARDLLYRGELNYFLYQTAIEVQNQTLNYLASRTGGECKESDYVHYFLGLHYLNVGELQLAKHHFDLFLQSSSDGIYKALSNVQLATVEYFQGNETKALRKLKDLLSQQTQSEIQAAVGYAYARIGIELDAAEKMCQDYPHYSGLVAYQKNNFAGAINLLSEPSVFKEALLEEKCYDDQSQVYAFERYFYDIEVLNYRSMTYFQLALKKAGDDLFVKGMCQFYLGDFDAAENMLNQIQNGSADVLTARFYLGLIFGQKGDLDRQHQIWEEIVNSKTKRQTLNRVNYEENFAYVKAARGEYLDAVKYFLNVVYDVKSLNDFVFKGTELDQKTIQLYEKTYIENVIKVKKDYVVIPDVYLLAKFNAQIAYWYQQTGSGQFPHEITRTYQRLVDGTVFQIVDGTLTRNPKVKKFVPYVTTSFPEADLLLNLRSYLMMAGSDSQQK